MWLWKFAMTLENCPLEVLFCEQDSEPIGF